MKQLRVVIAELMVPKLGTKPPPPRLEHTRSGTFVVPIEVKFIDSLGMTVSQYKKLKSKQGPVIEVPIANLLAVQRFVFEDAFYDYVRQLQSGKVIKKLPKVLKLKSKYLLLDGTHRVCAAWSVGRTKVQVIEVSNEAA